MVRVSGPLRLVTDKPAYVSQVRIRAARERAEKGGLTTTLDDVASVKDGSVSFDVLPGAAVMVLEVAGGFGSLVKLLVPDAGQATLEECLKAAGDASEYSQRELEEMVLEVREALPKFSEAALDTWRAADTAGDSARAAAASASSASSSAGAARQAESGARSAESSASASASRASVSESNASDHASEAAQHEVAAKGYAQDAETSAGNAKASEERAATIAGSTRWVGNRLEVNGQLSPDLTGPQGPPGADGTMTFEELTPAQRESLRGEDGKPGTTSWAGITDKPAVFPPAEHTHSWSGITGKPTTFAPSSHTHTSSQVTDAVNDAGASRFGGKVLKGRDSDGKIFYYSAPSEDKELANKAYVDRKANEAMSRPAFFSGQGAPPASIPGARVGDYWLNESTMELHKITSV